MHRSNAETCKTQIPPAMREALVLTIAVFALHFISAEIFASNSLNLLLIMGPGLVLAVLVVRLLSRECETTDENNILASARDTRRAVGKLYALAWIIVLCLAAVILVAQLSLS